MLAVDSTRRMLELTEARAAAAGRSFASPRPMHRACRSTTRVSIWSSRVGLIPWLLDTRPVLDEFRRVLRPPGGLVITADNRWRLTELADPSLSPLFDPVRRWVVRPLKRRRGWSAAPFEPRRHSRAALEQLLTEAGFTSSSHRPSATARSRSCAGRFRAQSRGARATGITARGGAGAPLNRSARRRGRDSRRAVAARGHAKRRSRRSAASRRPPRPRARGHQADELRAGHLRPARLGLVGDRARRSRAAPPPPSPRRSCSPGRARRAAGRARARARPGSRRRVSRTTAAISRATSSVAAEVDVERDQRPPRADDHAAGRRVEPRGPEVGRELARVDPPLQLLRPAAPEERRPAPGRRVEEDRQPELADAARRACAPPRRARSMSPGPSGTIGTTSAAPIRGCAPVVPAQVDPLARAPRRRDSASTSSSSSPTSVKTERLWSASACTSSSRACADERRADRVDRRRGRVPRRSSAPTRAAARAYSRSGEGVLPRASAASTTTGGSAAACSPTATGRAGTRSATRARSRDRRAPGRRARSTSPAAPASSRGTCPARSSGSTRATRCSRIAAEQAPQATFVQGDALDAAVRRTARSSACSPSYFYCHLEEDDRVRVPRRGPPCRPRARRASSSRARDGERARALGGTRC